MQMWSELSYLALYHLLTGVPPFAICTMLRVHYLHDGWYLKMVLPRESPKEILLKWSVHLIFILYNHVGHFVCVTFFFPVEIAHSLFLWSHLYSALIIKVGIQGIKIKVLTLFYLLVNWNCPYWIIFLTLPFTRALK